VSGEKSEYERFSYAGSNIFEIKNGDGEIKEEYISGQNIDEIYGKIESNGNEEYYIRDYLGNIKAIFDKDGIMKDYRRYRAYGEEEKESISGFGFTSREYDEITGLYYYRSRYYDPTIGRFMQKDKYNEAGLLNNDPSVVYNPSQLNNYAYVANNPVNYVDPLGWDSSTFNSKKITLKIYNDSILNVIEINNFNEKKISSYIKKLKNNKPLYSVLGNNCDDEVLWSIISGMPDDDKYTDMLKDEFEGVKNFPDNFVTTPKEVFDFVKKIKEYNEKNCE